jgi:hypothetical protein
VASAVQVHCSCHGPKTFFAKWEPPRGSRPPEDWDKSDRAKLRGIQSPPPPLSSPWVCDHPLCVGRGFDAIQESSLKIPDYHDLRDLPSSVGVYRSQGVRIASLQSATGSQGITDSKLLRQHRCPPISVASHYDRQLTPACSLAGCPDFIPWGAGAGPPRNPELALSGDRYPSGTLAAVPAILSLWTSPMGISTPAAWGKVQVQSPQKPRARSFERQISIRATGPCAYIFAILGLTHRNQRLDPQWYHRPVARPPRAPAQHVPCVPATPPSSVAAVSIIPPFQVYFRRMPKPAHSLKFADCIVV